MPDYRRVRIRLGLNGARLGVFDQFGGDVAGLGRLDAPQVANAFVMLRILAGTNDDLVADDHRCGDGVALGATAAQLVLGVLWIGVKLPDELAGLRLEG